MTNDEYAKRKIEHDQKYRNQCLIYPGPIGATGPTGPTGPLGPGSNLGGIQLQFINDELIILNQNDPIIFNTIINQNTSDITYNSNTGEISFNRNASYYISWWVINDGSSDVGNISISFTNGIQNIVSETPIVTGQLSGSAFINVINAAEVWKLINNSPFQVSLGNTPIHANITIIEVF